MSTKFIVECPDCKVRFFVTEELLATAYGVLRCGFCSHVFNGKEHIVYQTLDTRPKQATVTESASTLSKKNNQEDTIASPQKQPEDTPDYWSGVVDTLSSFSVNFNAVDGNEKPISKKEEDRRQSNPPQDSQTLIEESSSPSSSEVDLNYVDPDIVERIEHIDFDHLLVLEEQALLAKKANAGSLLVEEKIEEKQGVDDFPLSVISKDYNEGDTEPKDIYGNSLKKVSYSDFVLEAPVPKKIRKSTFVWGGLSFLAVLFLAGQYVRFIAPDMALHEESRALAEKVCSLLLCDIPPLVDVGKIKTNQLVVSESSRLENVLNVDAIIENNLKIAQPYPIVELRFTDLNGQPIASRRFLPNEYMGSDVVQNDQMQPNSPTYISFEVIDPGETAVGYSLYYYPAN